MPTPPKPAGSPSEATTRDRLVQTARALFHDQGYGATGLAQILREADVRSGSLYHYFKSKDDLLIAVLELYRDNIWPMLLQPVFDRHPDPLDRVFGLLAVYRRQLVASDFQSSCPIGNLALEVSELQPRARALIEANFEQWRAVVRDCLVASRDRFAPETDLDRVATFVLTTMEGAVMLSRSYQDTTPFDAAVEALSDYLERLSVDRGAKPSRHSEERKTT